MIAAALLFVSSGAAFAHDWNDRNHRPPGKAYGHYKVQKHHRGWNQKQYRPSPRYGKRYSYKKFRDHRHYGYRHRRPVHGRNVYYKGSKNDSMVMFKIILKELR
jgi:hypothetical protein